MERRGFRLWTMPRGNWGAEATFWDAQPPDTVPVPCISLETLLAPFRYVDFIHCDIQGAEEDVLPSALDLLGAKVGRVIVSWNTLDADL